MTLEKRVADLEKKMEKVLAMLRRKHYTSDMDNDPKVTGSAGGKKRSEKLSPERRQEIARKAAAERWRIKK